jgi:hypothetical protein
MERIDAMRFQPFKCAVCNAGPAVVGFWCLCAGPATREVEPFAPEATTIVVKAPEPTHGIECEIERQLAMRPVAAIKTSHVGTASIIEGSDIAQGLGGFI